MKSTNDHYIRVFIFTSFIVIWWFITNQRSRRLHIRLAKWRSLKVIMRRIKKNHILNHRSNLDTFDYQGKEKHKLLQCITCVSFFRPPESRDARMQECLCTKEQHVTLAVWCKTQCVRLSFSLASVCLFLTLHRLSCDSRVVPTCYVCHPHSFRLTNQQLTFAFENLHFMFTC